MTPSKKLQANANDSNSDSSNSSNDSIPRYGGYKHSSPVYEDFEMWNSVCEDAEPGWEWKESQRQKREQRKKVEKGTTMQEEEKDTVKRNKEDKEETAKAARTQTPPAAPTISGPNSPFNYRQSERATQLCTQILAQIMYNSNYAILEDRESEVEHRTKSCQGLTLEDALDISRPENIKKQHSSASRSRNCALM
ncbi:hypothetical protein KCU65_g1851, partial [Aureobasidium melanogenum]